MCTLTVQLYTLDTWPLPPHSPGPGGCRQFAATPASSPPHTGPDISQWRPQHLSISAQPPSGSVLVGSPEKRNHHHFSSDTFTSEFCGNNKSVFKTTPLLIIHNCHSWQTAGTCSLNIFYSDNIQVLRYLKMVVSRPWVLMFADFRLVSATDIPVCGHYKPISHPGPGVTKL